MIEVTYVCDECGETLGPITPATCTVLRNPDGWRKYAGLLKCPGCRRKAARKKDAAYFNRGPYWVCPDCFKVLASARRYCLHSTVFTEGGIMSSLGMTDIAKCRLPPGVPLFGPYKDGRVATAGLQEIYDSFVRSPAFRKWFDAQPRRHGWYDSETSEGLPKELSDNLRNSLVSFLETNMETV
jgi:hypothetical protein